LVRVILTIAIVKELSRVALDRSVGARRRPNAGARRRYLKWHSATGRAFASNADDIPPRARISMPARSASRLDD